MKGSARNAKRLLSEMAKARDSHSVRGFSFLGEGTTRVAYLCEDDGMVYKVMLPDEDAYDSQIAEGTLKIKDISLPAGWRIAKSKLVWVDNDIPVVVMEHIEGEWEHNLIDGDLHEWEHEKCTLDCAVRGLCYYKILEVVEEETGIWDLGVFNYLVEDDGFRTIFDYALTRH